MCQHHWEEYALLLPATNQIFLLFLDKKCSINGNVHLKSKDNWLVLKMYSAKEYRVITCSVKELNLDSHECVHRAQLIIVSYTFQHGQQPKYTLMMIKVHLCFVWIMEAA